MITFKFYPHVLSTSSNASIISVLLFSEFTISSNKSLTPLTKYSLNSSDENLLSLSYSCSNGSRSLPYNPFTTNSLAPVFTSLYLWIVICKSLSVSVTIYSTLTKKNTPLCSILFSSVLIASAIPNSSLYYTLCTSIATMCSLLTYKKP